MLKKSVIIAGRHATSISLETEFFNELQAIARKRGITLNALITEIDENRSHNNLSSAIRVYILQYVKKNPEN